LLMLDSTKAMNLLGWRPVYSIDESISETIKWYKKYVDQTSDIEHFSLGQIQKYTSKAKEMNISWSH
jgi:CDP-glucose 4,6-dehydratase